MVNKLFCKTAASVVAVLKAFFGIRDEDGVTSGAGKVISTVCRRVLYTIADYWLAALSAVLVIAMKSYGFSFVQTFLVLWLFDFVVAGVFVVLYEKTGKDLTLGGDYRRGVDVLFKKSKTAGILSFILTLLYAAVWSGPEYVVIFFRKEIATRSRLVLVLIFLAVVQAAFWTWVYSLGFESVSALIVCFIKKH